MNGILLLGCSKQVFVYWCVAPQKSRTVGHHVSWKLMMQPVNHVMIIKATTTEDSWNPGGVIAALYDIYIYSYISIFIYLSMYIYIYTNIYLHIHGDSTNPKRYTLRMMLGQPGLMQPGCPIFKAVAACEPRLSGMGQPAQTWRMSTIVWFILAWNHIDQGHMSLL